MSQNAGTAGDHAQPHHISGSTATERGPVWCTQVWHGSILRVLVTKCFKLPLKSDQMQIAVQKRRYVSRTCERVQMQVPLRTTHNCHVFRLVIDRLLGAGSMLHLKMPVFHPEQADWPVCMGDTSRIQMCAVWIDVCAVNAMLRCQQALKPCIALRSSAARLHSAAPGSCVTELSEKEKKRPDEFGKLG